jgi:hypothetical protein
MSNLNELLKELEVSDILNKSNDEDKCLISGLKLNSDFINLECNHKFNYDSLLKEITYQKNTNYYFKQKFEILCPYCRKITKGLLPLNSNYIFDKSAMSIKNNIFKLNNKEGYFICNHIIKNGINKGNKCSKLKKTYNTQYCIQHNKINIKDDNIKKCTYILKRGKNKGNNCNKKVFNNNIDFCNNHKNKNN